MSSLHGAQNHCLEDKTCNQEKTAPTPDADISAINSSSHQGINEEGTDSYNYSESSDNAQPCGVEKLMKPMQYTVVRFRDTSTGPPSPAPANRYNNREVRSAKVCTCDEALASNSWVLPLRRVADGLVTTYFTKAQRIYPILHQHTFRRQYDRLWTSEANAAEAQTKQCVGLCLQKSRGKLFSHTLYAIFALAALLDSGPPEDNIAQAKKYFCQAEAFNFFDAMEHDIGLEFVQLGLLMGFYLQSTERFAKCWNITGMAIRMAQNIGLHLSPSEARKYGQSYPCARQVDREMRARVWYGCVVLERYDLASFVLSSVSPNPDRLLTFRVSYYDNLRLYPSAFRMLCTFAFTY